MMTRRLTLLATAAAAVLAGPSLASGIDRTAPVAIETSIDIEAPPAIVWKILTDVSDWPSWNRHIVSARIDGELVSGAMIDWATGPEAGYFPIRSQITRVEAGRRLEWLGVGAQMEAVHSWRLEPVAGGTRVHNDESIRGGDADLRPEPLEARFEWFLQVWNEALRREAARRFGD